MVVEGRKKGGGRAPQEAADSLRSTQIAEVVMLISEGQAQGLVNGLKSVYLDKVPVENADGSRNFSDVEFAYVVGTQGQPVIDGLDAVQNEQAVGLQVDHATPVVRTITDAQVDHVRVTIGVPQLTYQNPESGDLSGSSFEWAVDVQSAGGGYVERHREVIDGKTTSLYATAVKLELTGAAPWDVRVRRVSADPASATVANRFSWQSYTEISSIKLRYPNSAVARLRVNAQHFGRIPTVAFDWLGQVVNVPANYDPLTRVYSGVWSGTFKPAWTNNPAWAVYDLVQHERYGLGQFVPAALQDKWALYAIAQYCDALVPDGRGGTEPRFTCNVNLEVAEEAYKVVQDLVAIFRGMAYWCAGGVTYAQDAPSDPVHLFTPANVYQGLFTYADTSEKTQHSMWVCWWNDITLFGQAVPEIYIDEALVARYGLRSVELRPLGLTSRGQAARACRWARHSEQLEGDVVSFEVGSDGVAVAPGQVFRIADPNEQGERLGGRVQAATATTVTLDAPVTLAAGETYTLSVLQPDPATPSKLLTETRTVTTPAGMASVLTVSAPFSAPPAQQTVWVLESDAIAATTWRCLTVQEVKGANRYRINAMAHNPSKYDAIELGLKLDQRPVSRLSLVPPRPASLASTETVYRAGQLYRSRITLSWPQPEPGLLYLLSWRLNAGSWSDLPPQSANSVDIDGLAPGTLDVQLRSQNALGNTSPPLPGLVTVAGGGKLDVRGPNLMDATWWAPGAAIQWAQNVSVDGDVNSFVWGLGPHGAMEALWLATAGTNGQESGGWDSYGPPRAGNDLVVDTTKTWRFALPVKRVGGDANVYWGPGGEAGRDTVVDTLNGSVLDANPYFATAAALPLGRWYLLVGFVFPAGQTGLSHAGAGIFDMTTGEQIAGGLNFNWHAGLTRVATRAYQYYASAGAQLLFGKPAVHVVDGSEPGLNDLLGPSAILNTQQQWADVQQRPRLYRAVAAGLSALGQAPAAPGLYDEQGSLSGVARSYVVNAFDRVSGTLVFGVPFDVYGNVSAAGQMADLLNALQADRIVVVRSHDEPQANRLAGGLEAAMYRCGASRAVFGSPQFKSRAAYVLVAVPGCGEGQGFEAYQGAVDNDTNAWTDIAFAIDAQGKLLVTGSSATPRSLADYSYTGDLNATVDLALVNVANCTIAGNAVTKSGGATFGWDANARSRDGYTGGCYASWVVDAIAGDVYQMVSIDSAPTGTGYAQFDHALYHSNGALYAYEAGSSTAFLGSCAVGDVLSIEYDGANYVWRRNGTALRTKFVGAVAAALFLGVGLYARGGSVRGLRFVVTRSAAMAGSNLYDSMGRITSDTRLLRNLLDSSRWTLGSSGSQPGFSAIGYSSENAIVVAVRADGSTGPVWECTSDGGNDASGGWDSEPVAIDPTKMYRSVLALCPLEAGAGNVYHGAAANNQVRDIPSGALNTNPYFTARTKASLVPGRWYLSVGYILPASYAGAQLSMGGLYDGVTGERVFAEPDFKWDAAATVNVHRAYQYYETIAGHKLRLDRPRFEQCDGSEPSLKELLAVIGTQQLGMEAASATTVFDERQFTDSPFSGANGLAASNGWPFFAFVLARGDSEVVVDLEFEMNVDSTSGAAYDHTRFYTRIRLDPTGPLDGSEVHFDPDQPIKYVLTAAGAGTRSILRRNVQVVLPALAAGVHRLAYDMGCDFRTATAGTAVRNGTWGVHMKAAVTERKR